MSYFEYMEMALDAAEENRVEKTVAIIKPDAVRMGGEVIGVILTRAAAAGLHPVTMWMGELSRSTWEEFYAEHRERDFFAELIGFMTTGPSVFTHSCNQR